MKVIKSVENKLVFDNGLEIIGVGDEEELGVIKWHEESCAFKWLSGEPSDEHNYWLSQSETKYRLIKGNITNNPELMGASND